MLSVTNKPCVLSVARLNDFVVSDVMLSVEAPFMRLGVSTGQDIFMVTIESLTFLIKQSVKRYLTLHYTENYYVYGQYSECQLY
jgi:hypothetical protein